MPSEHLWLQFDPDTCWISLSQDDVSEQISDRFHHGSNEESDVQLRFSLEVIGGGLLHDGLEEAQGNHPPPHRRT